MRELEESLHYNFKNPHLLHQALTHTSKTGKLSENYERLEFLGRPCAWRFGCGDGL